MVRNFWLSLTLAILALNNLAKSQPRGMFEEAKYALVLLRVDKNGEQECGTGFIIDSTAHSLTVLTNRHVVAKEDPQRKWEWADAVWLTPYGQTQEFLVADSTIRFFPDGDDVAILEIERPRVPGFRILTLSKRLQFDGMKVYALSYPACEGRPKTILGIIESRDEPFYEVAFAATEREVVGGESGSPVLNERGIVVGMVTEKFVTEKGSTNRLLHSIRIRSALERFQAVPPLPSENQVLALLPLDFDPPYKQREWSYTFIKRLKAFFANCRDIYAVSEGDLEYYSYRKYQSQNFALGHDDYYRMPSYLVTGWCRRSGKVFQFDVSLALFPGEEVVWSKRLEANSLPNLADSVGVYMARYFGYKTKFVGVPHGWRKWSLRTTLAGILPSVLLWRAAAHDKNDYREALRGQAAATIYDDLHRNEILRNSMTIMTGISFGFWLNAAMINPRTPVFEKIEVK